MAKFVDEDFIKDEHSKTTAAAGSGLENTGKKPGLDGRTSSLRQHSSHVWSKTQID
jgi:hypothetical protein